MNIIGRKGILQTGKTNKTFRNFISQRHKDAGRANEKLNIARNALAKGLAPEIVRDITGLSMDEIEKLQT